MSKSLLTLFSIGLLELAARMAKDTTSINHEQFIDFLEEAEQMVFLSDGGQIAILSEGRVAHFSAISGEGCLIYSS
ncbi:hypothetical protein HSBAA_31010 [Vreelandella sulfidaeris]|uniref:Uncharacterized protein n=1 Tax=Vreelandella sulfidaeris TaxID=115553 RepID=A0A455U757_9GAMM|nr:hypothetical protein HSBAA_31010 [Halomonas sulfidaeris]